MFQARGDNAWTRAETMDMDRSDLTGNNESNIKC